MQHPPKTLLVDIEAVERSPFNFRMDLSSSALKGLRTSIRKRGLIHPILVRPHPDKSKTGQYEIVCGERRFSAIRQLYKKDPANWQQIPVRVEHLDDTQALAAMMQENELRQDWSAYEKAQFFRAAYEEAQFKSIRDMARQMDIGLTTLHRYLRIFDLPAKIVDAFKEEKLSLALIEVILETPPSVRMSLADHLISSPCNKSEARRLARSLSDPSQPEAAWIDDVLERIASDSVPADVEATELPGEKLRLEITGTSVKQLVSHLTLVSAALKKRKAKN